MAFYFTPDKIRNSKTIFIKQRQAVSSTLINISWTSSLVTAQIISTARNLLLCLREHFRSIIRLVNRRCSAIFMDLGASLGSNRHMILCFLITRCHAVIQFFIFTPRVCLYTILFKFTGSGFSMFRSGRIS
uniref:Uncharacterized protein n=1 Tax=Arundo donax TaxID=35708 RepID=A0A0A9ED67_ARUDO